MAAIGNWQAAIENIWKVHCNSITDNFKDLRNEIDKIQFVNKMKYIRQDTVSLREQYRTKTTCKLIIVNTNKASGPDGLPNIIMKTCA